MTDSVFLFSLIRYCWNGFNNDDIYMRKDSGWVKLQNRYILSIVHIILQDAILGKGI